MEAEKVLARLLVKTGALQLGEFKLTSGLQSPIYIDLRRLPSYPDAFRTVLALLYTTSLEADHDVVVGVATAGIVWATGLALYSGKPMAYVRSGRKQHGLGRQVEGLVEEKRVLVVDDVATTGGSLAAAVEALRSAGAQPRYALVIVDREQGARERLQAMGVELLRVATLRGILRAAVEEGLVAREDAQKVIDQLYGGEWG
ncbi:orotate phosphoribosyltransferase [Pyrodictium delaneyi]|nr:orotate phosphoribosyltransferase [Pyrodictium delaneyi]OWJ54151.1 orotate phosphoribosyltransferase [Pyrodictium delaneyi]